MKKIVYIVILLLIFGQTQSFAWGRRGHMLVVKIAFNMLDSATRERVEKYIEHVSDEEAGNWMDEIKSEHKYDYMKQWHYVNVDKGNTYQPTKEENVITQLTRVINELEHHGDMSDGDIKKDILVACHLTGDMHQPLHVGYGVDKGGNDIHVTFKGKSTNLHRVWDSELIESENITYGDCLNYLKTFDKEQIAAMSVINVENWMRQPRSQLTSVYNFQDGTLDDAYVARNKRLVEEDLVLGGIRLAAIFREAFKS